MSLEHTEKIKVQQAKEDLAEQYIAEFKDDLSFLKKMSISLVEKKIKELLLQDAELTDNLSDYKLTRRQEKLASFSPTTTEKVISFLKEKQKLLLKVQTQKQLEALKQGIDPSTVSEEKTPDNKIETVTQTTEDDHNPSNDIASEKSPDNVHIVHPDDSMAGVGILGAGGAGWIGQEIWAKNKLGSRAEQLTNTINQKELKTSLQNIKKTLEAQTQNPKLLTFQKNNIKKTLKVFQEAEKNAGAVDDLALWKNLAKTNKVSGALFGKMSTKEIQALSKSISTIVGDTALLEQIAKTSDPTVIKSLLHSKGITAMTDTMIESFARIEKVEDITSLTHILSKGTEIKSLAKAAKFLPLIDVAALGYDIYNYVGDNEKANKMRNTTRKDIAHNRANAHLVGGIADFALGASALLAGGPPGWVAVAGVAVIEGGKIATDRLYYDVQDFYAQDKIDFVTQTESQIDQAILDAAVGDGWDNLSLNEEVCEFFGGIDKTKKMQTLEDVLWAKILLDEKDNFSLVCEYAQIQAYKANLENYTPEQQETIHQQEKAFEAKKEQYETERKQLDTIIATRMEYITPFLPGGDHFVEFTQQVKNNNGLAYLNMIIKKSNTYVKMKGDPLTQATTTEQYLTEQETKLQDENPTLFTQLKTLQKNDPTYYDEIIHHVRSFDAIVDETYRQEKSELFTISSYIIRRSDRQESSYSGHYHQLNIETDYSGIEKTLTDIVNGKGLHFTVTPFTQEELSFGLDTLNTISGEQYTNDLSQNVLYRFFREFHHYNGSNNITKLQEFAMDDGGEKGNDSLGIYYNPSDKKRYLNDDNALDGAINLQDIGTMNAEEWEDKYFVANAGFLETDRDIIDGSTETADNNKTKEFINTFKRIMNEEKALRTPDNQKKVSDEILTYIKNHAQTNGHILLPHHLAAAGARAGLGEMQYWFFSLDAKGNIIATTDAAHISSSLHLSNINKQYSDKNGKIITINKDSTEEHVFDEIDTMTEEIKHTMGELQHSSERGNISYNPETETLSSRGYSITCSYNKETKKRTIGDNFPFIYNTIDEAFRTANLINKMKKYKKDHADAEFAAGYMKVIGGIYNTSTRPDTQIIDPETITEKYPSIEKQTDTFVTYLNNLTT